jgi:hypothetical protein
MGVEEGVVCPPRAHSVGVAVLIRPARPCPRWGSTSPGVGKKADEPIAQALHRASACSPSPVRFSTREEAREGRGRAR